MKPIALSLVCLFTSTVATAAPVDRFRSTAGTQPITQSSFADGLELYLVGEGRADLAGPLRQVRKTAGPAAAVQAGGLAASWGLGGASVGAGALAITGGLMRRDRSEQVLIVGLGAVAVALGLVASAVGPALMSAASESYAPQEEAVLFEVVQAFNQDRPVEQQVVLMSGALDVSLPGSKGIVAEGGEGAVPGPAVTAPAVSAKPSGSR